MASRRLRKQQQPGPDEIIMLGPCPDCGSNTRIRQRHLQSVLTMAASIHGDRTLSLSLDAFESAGADWTAPTVPTEALLVVAASMTPD